MLEKYKKERKFSMWSEREEANALEDFIENIYTLTQSAAYIEVNGNILGFSIGERVNDTLMIHVEKARKEYQGVYPTLANGFAKMFATGGIKYINRGEDCGDLGLRTSKMQYQPIVIKEKNSVSVSFLKDKNLLYKPITTERLSIDEIQDTDKQKYFELYTDDEVNKYYGYDYKEDLVGIPTPDYFYEFQKKLKKTEFEFSFAVRKDGKMIGELVVYHFDYYASCEIGFRFFKEFWGKGYARESVTAFIKSLFNNGIKTIKCRVIKENCRSANLLVKIGFLKYKDDTTYDYYCFEE